MKGLVVKFFVGLLLLLGVNFLANQLNTRFDLTQDRRYTLSDTALSTVQGFDAPVTIDVLLEGNLPPEFLRLQEETIQLLEGFEAENGNIRYQLIDPFENTNRGEVLAELQQLGLKPASVTINEDGKVSQQLVLPWAIVNQGETTVKVPLLKNKMGANTQEERINNSVQNLEYAFADAFFKLGLRDKKSIAVIKGNGELEDAHLADFLQNIQEYYRVGNFTLDATATNPQKTLNQLKAFDLALIAKPVQPFSEEEKYVLDQFVVTGGKSLWLIDKVTMELDSLINEAGRGVATIRDVNLDDFFFKYGIRINPVLVNDRYNTPIVLASGEANNSQYNPLPWSYHPMVFSENDHPINTNIEALWFQFANTIDTLDNANKKTVLLRSSPLSRPEGVPKEIRLASISEVTDANAYSGLGYYPLAVLVEGEFTSAYKNRIKPFQATGAKEEGMANKMIVIADGDLIKNQLKSGRPLELGYDKWTNSFYGNKEFLVNCVNYLLDDTGLIDLRSKKVSIPMLDLQKIADQKRKWQLWAIGFPLILIGATYLLYGMLRRRRYASRY